MSTAEYSIDGDPFSNGGFDCESLDDLTLALENPGVDVETVKFSIVNVSKYADPGAFTPSTGFAATPSSSVNFNVGSPTVASRAYSIRLRSVVNGGRNADGTVNPEFTKDRIVSIRNAAGLRAPLVGETYQYDLLVGWCGALEEIIAVLDLAAADDMDEHTHAANGELLPGVLNLLGPAVTAMTFPQASTCPGRPFPIAKQNNANAVTLTAFAGDAIKGGTSIAMSAADLWESRSFIASKNSARIHPFPSS